SPACILSAMRMRSAGLRGDQDAFSKLELDISAEWVFKAIAWKLLRLGKMCKPVLKGPLNDLLAPHPALFRFCAGRARHEPGNARAAPRQAPSGLCDGTERLRREECRLAGQVVGRN